MKMNMNTLKKWKRRMLAIALIVIGLSAVATGTYAYFVAEETAYNVITTGALFMDLVEETEDGKPWPEEGIKNVMPATDVGKVVYIENRGSVPFFARIQKDVTVTPAPGVTAELTTEHISIDINTECWIERGDFYYYYRSLQPGEKTEPLFTKVSFAGAMGNEYQNCTVEVYVLAQAVQSDNNGYDPLMALGWSEPTKMLIQNIESEE